MKKRNKLFCALVLALAPISLVCWLRLFQDYRQMTADPMEGIEQQVAEAMKAADPELTMARSVRDTPVTFTGAQGDTIVCHCLTTTYYNGRKGTGEGLDLGAIEGILNPADAEETQVCRVREAEALLCRKGDQAYLCWTLSETYSFVIEYTPEAVAEEEIFAMAESISLPRE